MTAKAPPFLVGFQKKILSFWFLFSGFLLVFILSRLAILFTSIESVSWKEDLSMGTIAREIIRGTSVPFWKFQLDLYSGESLLIGVLAVPFFYLLGENLIALKLPTFLFSLASLVLSAVFLKRHFGRKAALWTTFFLTFCPPIFLSHFLLVQSGHSEALFFRMLILIFFYHYLFSKKSAFPSLLAFGFLGGLAISFYYGTAVTLISCLVLWGLTRLKPVCGVHLLVLGLAALIGLIPWIAGNIFHHFHGIGDLLTFFPDPIEKDYFLSFPKRFLKIIFISLPLSFSFLPREHFLNVPAAYAYYFLALVPTMILISKKMLSFSLKKKSRQKILFFFIHISVFFLIFLILNFEPPQEYDTAITFRYFTPLLYSLFTLLGISVGQLKIKGIILYPLVTISILSSSCLYFNEPFAQGLRYKGYSYKRLAVDWDHFLNSSKDLRPQIQTLSSFFEMEDSRVFFLTMLREKMHDSAFSISLPASWENIPEAYSSLFARRFPSYLYFREGRKGFDTLIEEAKNIPKEDQLFFYKGLLNFFEVIDLKEFMSHPELLKDVPPRYHHWAYWHFGSYCQKEFMDDAVLKEIHSFVSKLPENFKRWFYRGVGSAVLTGRFLNSNIYIYQDYYQDIQQTAANIPLNYREDFYWGVGWRFRGKFLRDQARIDFWIKQLPSSFQDHAADGSTAYNNFYELTQN